MNWPHCRVSLWGFALLMLGMPAAAMAGPWGHRYGHSHSVYHPPSVHYDRVYHEDYLHWTPFRGLHSHGHYDIVPHYTPGHYDRWHRGHIDGNPWFHH
ncbi:hypothetical protein K2Y11_24550 [bacterium]|nr:hypothetical protein [bacterium]